MAPSFVKRFTISFQQHKFLAFFSCAAVIGAAGVFAMIAPPPEPPKYKATGIFAFDSPEAVFTATGEQVQEQGKQLNPNVLLADAVVEQTAANMTAANVPMEPSELGQLIRRKLKKKDFRISFPEEGEPPVITLTLTDGNRELSAVLLNELMKSMVEQSRVLNASRLQERIAYLEERLPPVLEELKQAEASLDQFVRKEGVALLAAQDGTLVGEITSSQQQQRQVQLTLEGVETQIASLVNRLKLTPDEAYTASALSADPILANLRAQILQNETQIELFGQDLRPEHPTMVELYKQQQVNETLLLQRAAELIGDDNVFAAVPSQIRQGSSLDPTRQQLANNLVVLQTQRETLISQLENLRLTEQELRKRYEDFPNKQTEQARRAQEVQFKQNLYNQIQTALADAKAAEAGIVSSLRIAQAPDVEAIPVVPPMNPVLVMLAGVGGGIFVGAGLIFILSKLDDRSHTPQELRIILTDQDVVNLGELPIIDSQEEQNFPMLSEANGQYLPGYELVRSNIRRRDSSAKVLLLTSITRGEGKSLTAYNLAVASAQAGKRTLLIETDLRSPTKAQALEVELPPNAHFEPLRYYGSRMDCIRLVPEVENLYVVPSPGPQRQAAAIIESSELRQLIKNARGRFDLVLIDTPALSSCNDAQLLQPLTDGIVLVTRPGITPKTILETVLEEMIDEELPLLGAVINGCEEQVPLSEEEVATEIQLQLSQTDDQEDEEEFDEVDEEFSPVPEKEKIYR